jgi:hypothetical protein
MAAPEYVPVPPTERPRLPWKSPDHVPTAWIPDRPADFSDRSRQPTGPRLGNPGPDIGYALRLAELVRPEILSCPGDDVDDAVAGCVDIAMRRAATYGRAPVMQDLRLAFRMWGWFDDAPAQDLVGVRRTVFEAARHDYEIRRAVVDRVPESTLRMTLAEVQAAYPARWRELVGV